MGKSIIPFILENPNLCNIFLEAVGSKNISRVFSFEKIDFEELKTNTFKIIIADNSAFKIMLSEKVITKKIFLIDDTNLDIGIFKVDAEVIKFNVPFKINDICQRIENDLVQENNNRNRLIRYKKFTYDPSTRKLSGKSVSLRFTEKESQIFIFLLENTNSYVSKKDLLKKVWSYGEGIDTHTLETHVYALRRKIEEKLMIKDLIIFEEKKGYHLNKSIL
tara:strand:+ start:1320 stop:1979 length:660 start_codon:yes stop_codon:yes gene_type:complete